MLCAAHGNARILIWVVTCDSRPGDGVRVLAVGHVGEALGAALPRG